MFFDALDEINMGLDGADIQAIQRWETGTYWRQGNIVPCLRYFQGHRNRACILAPSSLAMFTDWAQARYSALSWSLESTHIRWSRTLDQAPWAGGFRSALIGYARGFLDEGETQIYFFLGRWF